MKPAAFQYHAPRSLPDALAVLQSHPEASPLAGGQSLMPLLNARLATAPHLLDLGRVEGLDRIEEADDTIRIGAMVRQGDLLRSALLRRALPLITEAAAHIGHAAIRNRGTIGGSLCQLDPWAELPLVAMLLDAAMHLASPAGTRSLPFRDFAIAAGRNARQPGELLTHVTFPAAPATRRHGFAEIAERPNDPADAAAAVTIDLDAKGTVTRAAVAVAGPFPVARRLPAAEALLTGQRPTPALRQQASETALPPGTDHDHATLVRVALRRALEQAA